jgi:hypothetical protein
VGSSGIADDGTTADAGRAEPGSCATNPDDKPKMATPKTSRAPAPTKTDRIHSPVLRVGVGRRELPKRQIGWGKRRSDLSLLPLSAKTPTQCQQAASLIIDNSCSLDAWARLLDTKMSHPRHRKS